MVRSGFLSPLLMAALLVGTPFLGSAAATESEAPPSSEVNAILASVSGEPILLSDVLPYTRAKEFQLGSSLSGAALVNAVREARKEAVEALIDRRLLIAEYKKKPFDILPTVVDQQVDEAAERFGCRSRREFTVRLRERGISIDDFRHDVEERLICQIMLFRNSQMQHEVTPKEIYDKYQKEIKRFRQEEQLNLALILIGKDHASRQEVVKGVAAELAAKPDSFASVAKLVSDGPGAVDGGRIGRLDRSALRPEFQKALPEEVKAGAWFGPLESSDGTFFIKVLEVVPAQKKELSSVSEQLKKEIEAEQQEKGRKAYLKKLRDGAVIRYYF